MYRLPNFRTCEFQDCSRKYYAGDFCKSHWVKAGSPDSPDLPPPPAWHIDYAGRAWTYSQHETNADGYVLARVPGVRRSIGLHRVFMQDALGRDLVDAENVHHKNGVRHDNRLSNLELWSVSQPAGQRAEDKVIWAREILGLYGDDDERFLYG